MKNEKLFPLLLRVGALILSTAALLCLVWANLDAISEALDKLREKLCSRREGCPLCRFSDAGEDEYEDWD